MPNILSKYLFGIASPHRGKFASNNIEAGLERSDASIVRSKDGAALIATWGVEAELSISNSDEYLVALLGNPRWRIGEDGPESHPSLVARRVIESFKHDGDSVLDKLAGDFVLVVVDSSNGHLLCAVDRVGIGSLYYDRLEDGSIVFASDLDLLKRYSGRRHSVSLQAIYDYTYYHAVPSPLTIYNGVRKLPPAHMLVFNNGETKIARYWVPEFATSVTSSRKELASELLDVMKRAVARCSPGHSVGGFLSGGLDSSTVCGLLREIEGRQVPAVSVGFDEEGYDEVQYARAAANHFNLDHIVHYMTPDEIADTIEPVADAYSEPFGNSSVAPAYVCARVAREAGISTLLAGDGGDELFAGNTRYRKQKLFEFYFSLPEFLRKNVTDPLFGNRRRRWPVASLRKLARYVEQANVRLPYRLQTFNLLEMNARDAVFPTRFLADIDQEHPTRLLLEEYQATDSDPINRILHSDWRFTLADNDLRKVIRTCEIAGVDVRFPLLDDEVVDFSARIPAKMKLRGLKLRHFYRLAVSDLLPIEVLEKSKHGFGLPFGAWLTRSARLNEMVQDALSDLRRRGIFLDAFIDSLLADHQQRHAAFFGNMVWVLAMLEWWFAAHEPNFSLSE